MSEPNHQDAEVERPEELPSQRSQSHAAEAAPENQYS